MLTWWTENGLLRNTDPVRGAATATGMANGEIRGLCVEAANRRRAGRLNMKDRGGGDQGLIAVVRSHHEPVNRREKGHMRVVGVVEMS